MSQFDIQPAGQYGLSFPCPACGHQQAHNVPATLNRIMLLCTQPGCRGWVMVALNWAITYGSHAAIWNELGLCNQCEEGHLLCEFDEEGNRLVTCTVCTNPGE